MSTTGSESEANQQKVFFGKVGKFHSEIDEVAPDGRGKYGGSTKEQLEKEYGPVELLTYHEAGVRVEAERTTDPVEINAETFHDQLEMLPPCKWKTIGNSEAFHCSELLVRSIASWYVRIEGRYFSLNCSATKTTLEVIGTVKKQFFGAAAS